MFTFEGINQLVKNEKVFEETYLCWQILSKSCTTSIFLIKEDKKLRKLKILSTNFFEGHSYDTKNNLERPRNFLKKKSKGSQRNDVEKGRFEDIL